MRTAKESLVSQTILLCEDDLTLCDLLQRLLRDKGYRVRCCHRGQEALQLLRDQAPDLLLLDLMLPDMDGFDLCRQVRGHFRAPIVMISGRAGEVDRICGLEIGADDYLCKPFGAAELVARVDAQLRRARDYALKGAAVDDSRLGELHLNRDRREVLLRGKTLHLTPKEYELLCALADGRGAVVSARQLLLRVWGYDAQIRTRTLDVHIGRLRAKIETDTSHPRYLLTVPGVGYRLCAPEEEDQAA